MTVIIVSDLQHGKLRIIEDFEGEHEECQNWVAEKVDEFLEYFSLEEGVVKFMFPDGRSFGIVPRNFSRYLIRIIYLK